MKHFYLKDDEDDEDEDEDNDDSKDCVTLVTEDNGTVPALVNSFLRFCDPAPRDCVTPQTLPGRSQAKTNKRMRKH